MEIKIRKFATLFQDRDRYERIRVLIEIRLNKLIFRINPSRAISYDEFFRLFHDPELPCLIPIKKEAEETFRVTISNFEKIIRNKDNLPFPIYFNADSSFSIICYALTRYLKPNIVLETGVGYGIVSNVVLQAMESNECGTLVSIDLPPILARSGLFTGLSVPEHLKKRWKMYFGSIRQQIPKVMKNTSDIGLFISDSANVYTLQRYEFEAVWDALSSGGVMVFNNIGRKLQKFLKSVDNERFYSIWQLEKPSCVTGILLKK